MHIWNHPTAKKIRGMIQYLKGAIRPRPQAPAPRQPQVSQPIATMSSDALPIPVQARPANAYAFSPMAPPQPAPPMNTYAFSGLPAVSRRMSLSAEDRMTQAERGVVQMCESSDGDALSPEEEVEAYKEFMRLEGLGVVDPSVGGFCRLVDKRFVQEREVRRAQGHAFNHPAGDLLAGLLKAYFEQHFRQESRVTFSDYLASLSRVELKLIVWPWLKDADDASLDETLRRFEQGVRMLSPEKRKKYEVKTRNGLMYWERWADGAPLCTSPESRYFVRKHDHPTGANDRHAIWVLSKEKKLYTHASKIYRFHHSSFTAGDYIICAGEWSVYKGRLEWISARSGHYMPSVAQLQQAVMILANTFGIGANTYQVECRDRAKNSLGAVPASKWLHESPAVLAQKYAPV